MTLASHIPLPQQRQLTNPSGDAPMKGYSVCINNPHAVKENASWWGDVTDLYFFLATLSCSHPYLVAAVLNLVSSGWQIDVMRLADGIAGSVEHAAFSFDAVIHPVLIWNQRRELAWPLVCSSAALAWDALTTISVSAAIWSNSSNGLFRYSCLNIFDKQMVVPLQVSLGCG